MAIALALTLHLIAAVIWVGGMFFAYVCLRPVAAQLFEPDNRLKLWSQVFTRFFLTVWVAILVIVFSGHGMIALYGGFANIGPHIHLMLATGYLMIALFAHLYFSPFKKLKAAVKNEIWPEAGKQLNKIRLIVAINLTLGMITIIIGAGGKYLF